MISPSPRFKSDQVNASRALAFIPFVADFPSPCSLLQLVSSSTVNAYSSMAEVNIIRLIYIRQANDPDAVNVQKHDPQKSSSTEPLQRQARQ
jgi:hypothetical protein